MIQNHGRYVVFRVIKRLSVDGAIVQSEIVQLL